MRKILVLLAANILIQLMFPSDTQAIPAFARKYGFNCNMCHAGFTKFNDFGQRYREWGYQIPGQEGKEATVFDSAIPLAMRLSLGFTNYSKDDGNSSTFGIYGFDLLSAGVFHKNLSYLVIYTPRIDEPSDSYGGYNSDNPAQLASLEAVNLVFSNLFKTALNLRIGKFEPAYHIISSKRTYYMFQSYEIYDYMTPGNVYNFSENQIGIELTGHYRSGFKYSLGVVNGNGANPDNNNGKDFYASLTQTFGAGDGQSSGQRIGVFGYLGSQPLTCPGEVVGAIGETNGSDNKSFTRFGITGNLNWNFLSLQLLYMMASDDKAMNSISAEENYEFSGGFVELDYSGLMNNRLVASVLYNWVSPPDYDSEKEISAVSGLIRYYLGDWVAVNSALHCEYTHRTVGSESKASEDVLAIALDFAF
jgi:hypothetical protein